MPGNAIPEEARTAWFEPFRNIDARFVTPLHTDLAATFGVTNFLPTVLARFIAYSPGRNTTLAYALHMLSTPGFVVRGQAGALHKRQSRPASGPSLQSKLLILLEVTEGLTATAKSGDNEFSGRK